MREGNGIQSTQKDKLHRETVSHASVVEKCSWEQNYRSFAQMLVKRSTGATMDWMMSNGYVNNAENHSDAIGTKLLSTVHGNARTSRIVDGVKGLQMELKKQFKAG
jgi:hypothetical protein